MEKLDLKDRKILYHLDLDSRQSFRSIGRKVGLSKDIVASRVKKLQEKEIITYFWTAIDTYKLGYQVFRIYINFQDINSEKNNEIINYFMECKNIWAVISMKGEIDLDVIFWVADVNEFYQFWNKTTIKYGQFFEKVTISTLNLVIAYKKSFLLPELFNKLDTEFYQMSCCSKTFQMDTIDYKILNTLALNARIPIIDLANILDCSTQTLKTRINNLIKKNIIRAFRVAIDYSEIGLQHYLINIYLKDHSKRKSILDYLKEKSYLEYVDGNIGWSDIQYEIVVKDMNTMLNITEEINEIFPNAIKKQSFLYTTKFHKERWLPEIEY